ncbi:hypothetical protein V8J38_11225 [Brevundimonas olei]|uniref:Uncharacterized protein n=1 Tax=Brevundimonas olei TaxID=657642 RepID=A0ABZ2IG00_9CAUL
MSDFRDLYIFASAQDAEHRFPRRDRPTEALVTDARSLNSMPEIIYGFRLRHAYLYAPVNENALLTIKSRQHRTAEESRLYDFDDEKPSLPVAPA